MSDLLWLGFGLVGQWLLGVAAAHQLLKRRAISESARGAELWGLGLALGIGLTAFLLFLWGLSGGLLGAVPSFVLAAAGWVLGSLTLWRRRHQPQATRPAERDQPAPARDALLRGCQWTVAILFVATAVQALLTPQRFWDERAIFAMKALVLHEERSLYSPDLLHPDFVIAHPRYPLLLPLAEQHIYALLGRADDRWAKIIPPLLYLALVLTFAGVASRHIRREQAWLFAVLLATTPALAFWEYGFLSSQADAPVACFHGLSVLYLWDWLRRPGRGSLPAAGLTGGLALFTKDEGIALLLVDLLAFSVVCAPGVWFSTGDRGKVLRRSGLALGLYAASALVIAVPWFWYRKRLPTTTEMGYLDRMSMAAILEGSRSLSWSVPHLLSRMFREWQQWGLTWWLMLAAGLTRLRRAFTPAQAILVLDVGGALLALLVAGVLAPVVVEEHLGGSSHRFLVQLVPSALLFAAGQWGTDAADG